MKVRIRVKVRVRVRVRVRVKVRTRVRVKVEIAIDNSYLLVAGSSWPLTAGSRSAILRLVVLDD